jgi:hypothetical protein
VRSAVRSRCPPPHAERLVRAPAGQRATVRASRDVAYMCRSTPAPAQLFLGGGASQPGSWGCSAASPLFSTHARMTLAGFLLSLSQTDMWPVGQAACGMPEVRRARSGPAACRCRRGNAHAQVHATLQACTAVPAGRQPVCRPGRAAPRHATPGLLQRRSLAFFLLSSSHTSDCRYRMLLPAIPHLAPDLLHLTECYRLFSPMRLM